MRPGPVRLSEMRAEFDGTTGIAVGLVGVIGLAYYLYTQPASSSSSSSRSSTTPSAAAASPTTPAAVESPSTPAPTAPATDTPSSLAETMVSATGSFSSSDDSSATASIPSSSGAAPSGGSTGGKGTAIASASGSASSGTGSGQTYTGKATFYTVRLVSVRLPQGSNLRLFVMQQGGVAGGSIYPFSLPFLMPSLTFCASRSVRQGEPGQRDDLRASDRDVCWREALREDDPDDADEREGRDDRGAGRGYVPVVRLSVRPSDPSHSAYAEGRTDAKGLGTWTSAPERTTSSGRLTKDGCVPRVPRARCPRIAHSARANSSR